MLRTLGKLTVGYAAAFALLSVAMPQQKAAAEQRPAKKYVVCTCGDYCETDCPSPYVCCA